MSENSNKIEKMSNLGPYAALEQIFDASEDLLCILGDNGRFVKTSYSWTKELGWSEIELCSKDWNDFVHPDDLQSTKDIYASALAGNKVENFKNRYICKNGSYKTLLWQAPGFQGTQVFSVAKIEAV